MNPLRKTFLLEPDPSDVNKKAGFTLVELMLSATITSLIVAGLMSSVYFQRKASKTQQLVNDMQQNVRSSMDMMVGDLHSIGYGFDFSGYKVAEWIDWVPGLTGNPTVHQTSPGKLSVIGAFDQPIASLQAPVLEGSTTITLLSGQGAQFNTTDRKVIFIGRTETARIVGIAGDTLTISTDPLVYGDGLDHDYTAGAEIELVQVVTYEWKNDPNSYPYTPHLMRYESSQSYYADWQKIAANNIDLFTVSETGDSISIELTARAAAEDGEYTHPTMGDHYRRTTLTRKVHPRNKRRDICGAN